MFPTQPYAGLVQNILDEQSARRCRSDTARRREATAVNGVVNPTFSYDANGNMTAGAGRSIGWTSFNMAASVTDGSASVGFTYDDRHARITQAAAGVTTTYLNDPITGTLSETSGSGPGASWRDYIVANGSIVAERFVTSGTVSVLYFNGDHLGSTSVLSTPTGAVSERDSYTAWGRRRNPDGSPNAACSLTSATTRGFTAQEMMDPQCYINLNARLYDPTTSRIPSPDPFVPNPFNGQSYNRYSYALNAPTVFIDPSGYVEDLNPEDYVPTFLIGGDPNDQPSDVPYGPQCLTCNGPETDNGSPITGDYEWLDAQGNSCMPGSGSACKGIPLFGTTSSGSAISDSLYQLIQTGDLSDVVPGYTSPGWNFYLSSGGNPNQGGGGERGDAEAAAQNPKGACTRADVAATEGLYNQFGLLSGTGTALLAGALVLQFTPAGWAADLAVGLAEVGGGLTLYGGYGQVATGAYIGGQTGDYGPAEAAVAGIVAGNVAGASAATNGLPGMSNFLGSLTQNIVTGTAAGRSTSSCNGG
ncbi:MAG TPA: RHS repeat-associated core domain-containing protein [Rhizomicrobium sp.]